MSVADHWGGKVPGNVFCFVLVFLFFNYTNRFCSFGDSFLFITLRSRVRTLKVSDMELKKKKIKIVLFLSFSITALILLVGDEFHYCWLTRVHGMKHC